MSDGDDWLEDKKPTDLEKALFAFAIELCKTHPTREPVFSKIRAVATEIEGARTKEPT